LTVARLTLGFLILSILIMGLRVLGRLGRNFGRRTHLRPGRYSDAKKNNQQKRNPAIP
jgi:Na+-transporting methylmalonyl-CoA/oxaloacetate decarboxylase gamma subunit